MFETVPPPIAARGDADYQASLASIERAIGDFKGCNEAELHELAGDLAELGRMAEKLQSGRVDIAVFGEISTGKSALINALVGDQRASVDVRGGWTKDVWHVPWESAGYCVPGLANSEVVLVDTPGLNEVDGAARGAMATAAASRADLVLFVVDSDINDTEYRALVELAASHKPILLILNKADLYRPDQLAALLDVFRGQRLAGIVDPNNIVTAQADPRDVEYVLQSANGRQRSEWRKPQCSDDELIVECWRPTASVSPQRCDLAGQERPYDVLRVRYREERPPRPCGPWRHQRPAGVQPHRRGRRTVEVGRCDHGHPRRIYGIWSSTPRCQLHCQARLSPSSGGGATSTGKRSPAVWAQW
jgi:small GTP-binding protein